MRASNKENEEMFAALDAYWDSDQSLVDEFVDCATERLLELREIDIKCIVAMQSVEGGDEMGYWKWRAAEPWSAGYIPSYRKSLAEVRAITERHLRCVEKSLRCRGSYAG
jgi:hypothetical protein